MIVAGDIRRGLLLEYATPRVERRRHRRAGMVGDRRRLGLDSLIKIGVSLVVVWELSGSGDERRRRALRLTGAAFVLLAFYLFVQSTFVLAVGHRARRSPAGIAWTATAAGVMFAAAFGKA
jgi:hypothetical protein